MSFDPEHEGWRAMPKLALPGAIGVPWSRRIDGVWRYGLLTSDAHLNPQGVVHGGVLMTLTDHALSLLAWEAAGRAPCTTIQLNTQFLNVVRPGDFVWVDGEVTRRTRTLVFTRGLLRVAERTVGAADGVWRILRAVHTSE